MNKKLIFVFLVAVVLSIAGFAQTKGRYTGLFIEEKIRATIKFISDDGFEGRSPGTRTGELAAKYIANQLQNIGIKPANHGSYFQPVSLVAVKTNPNTVLDVNGTSYKFGDDFVGSTGAQTANVSINAEMVFVGYGIDAIEQKWNDFKGKRKIIAARSW